MFSIVQIATTIPFDPAPTLWQFLMILAGTLIVTRRVGFPNRSLTTRPVTSERLESGSNRS